MTSEDREIATFEIGGGGDGCPVLGGFAAYGLGLLVHMEGVAAEQQVRGQIGAAGQVDDHLGDLVGIAKLLTNIGRKQGRDRPDARFVVRQDCWNVAACHLAPSWYACRPARPR